MAYANPRRGGIIAITLGADDELIGVQLTDGKQEILLSTRNGKAIRFAEQEVRATGRGNLWRSGDDPGGGRGCLS